MTRPKRINYAEVLRERARRYHIVTAAPDHKPLDHTQLRNKRNVARWRLKYLRQLKEDT